MANHSAKEGIFALPSSKYTVRTEEESEATCCLIRSEAEGVGADSVIVM